MISDRAIRIVSTQICGAWICTVTSDTGFCGWAVRIEYTLWSTSRVRIPKEVWQARAGSDSISISALCIRSARARIAGIPRLWRRGRPNSRWFWWRELTASIWISKVSTQAPTLWVMCLDTTLGIESTGASAGIDTSELETGLVTGTVWIGRALGSAVGGLTKVASDTGTDCNSILGSAFCIGPARGWLARVTGNRRTGLKDGVLKRRSLDSHLFRGAVGEGVSGEALQAGTDGTVLNCLALCVLSTGTWTNGHTSLVGTGFGPVTVRIGNTLGSAVGRGTDIVGQACRSRISTKSSTSVICGMRSTALLT
jgi:hypothetical protein